MSFGFLKSIWNSRLLPAVAAGLLLAASFPTLDVAGFAWVAPGLMLLAALGTRGAESFRIGCIAGLACHLASLYWLLYIPYRWHSIPIGPAAGWIALSAYLALYQGAWVWFCLKISNFKFEISNAPSPLHAAQAAFFGTSWTRRLTWTLQCAAAWVALEMIQARLFGGFPWNLLGVSQHRIIPLIQFASVTGVYGVSFLVAWTSVSLLCAGMFILSRPQQTTAWLGEVLLPFVAVAALFAFGLHQIAGTAAPARQLNVTLVQPSIPQTLIWDPAQNEKRFRDLLRLSKTALTNRTDLLIWPESAIPRMLRYDEETYTNVTGLAARHHVWMIVGSDDAEPSKQSGNPEDEIYYNSSFLISPEGQIRQRYNKRNLVVFGEYVPLARWLPFVKWVTPIQGSFTPGTRSVQFDMPDLDVQTSVLICFEDVFPGLAREGALPSTDFLVNLTNDGWFGKSAAQWQQAAGAEFRAVENGLPLVRCTNTGLTCWFDACGRRRGLFRDTNGSVYGSGFETVKIPLLPKGETRPPTFYNQHGDWLGWGCVAVTAFALAGVLFNARHGRRGGRDVSPARDKPAA